MNHLDFCRFFYFCTSLTNFNMLFLGLMVLSSFDENVYFAKLNIVVFVLSERTF